MSESGYSKAKVSRIIQNLEERGIVESERIDQLKRLGIKLSNINAGGAGGSSGNSLGWGGGFGSNFGNGGSGSFFTVGNVATAGKQGVVLINGYW